MVAVSGDIESLGVTILISTISDIITSLGDVALRVTFLITKLLPRASSCTEDSVFRYMMALSTVLVVL